MKIEPESNLCPKCKSTIEADAPGGLCPRCLMEFVAFSTGGDGLANKVRAIPTCEQVQDAFPQLEIQELIGQGGMGAVFRARQPKLDRLVALKLLPTEFANEPQFSERFAREGRLLARLSHPNIVTVYDFGEQSGYYYLMMEYVDGVNLRQAYATSRFSQEQSLSLIPRICDALQYAHDEGVLHRDIKPENILLDTKGRLKIADFGIAKFMGSDGHTGLTFTGSKLGTPHYMAPEQVESPADVDHRADIYSLGVVFYEMLTGELPLGRFASPSERSHVDARIDQVVLRSLEKDRERRQQSAREVRTQVESIHQPHARLPSASSENVGGYVWQLRAYIALGLVLFSSISSISLLARYQRPGVPSILLALIVLFAIPGTILGWMHVYGVHRSGLRKGLYAATIASTVWPIAIVLMSLISLSIFAAQNILPKSAKVGEEIWIAAAIVTAAIFAYRMLRWCIWPAVCDGDDPQFLIRYRKRYTSSPAVFMGGAFLWCLISVSWLIRLEEAWVPARANGQLIGGSSQVRDEPVARLLVTDIETKVNVLLITIVAAQTEPESEVVTMGVASDAGDAAMAGKSPISSVPFRVEYYGETLNPQAANLATRSYDGFCFYPGEQSNQWFELSQESPTITLGFAFPDEEAAIATKNKINRLRGQFSDQLMSMKGGLLENEAKLFDLDIGMAANFTAVLVRMHGAAMAGRAGEE
jgi:serine/threonine protein kinase